MNRYPRWEHRPRLARNREERARFFRRMLARMAVLGMVLFAVAAGWTPLSAQLGFPGWAPVVPAVILFVMLAAGVFSFGGMRGFVRPLSEVMDAADRVADGDYDVRVREAGPTPIRALARSFNTMTSRLSDADRLRRDLMADLAHELRTPLTVLQGRLEGLIDGVYPRDDAQLAQLLEETQVLSRLIEDLRTLALSEAGQLPLQTEATDLAALARDAAGSMQGDGATISVTSPATVMIEIDPIRIREVLTNLLSNALRHTPESGRIEVAIVDAPERVTVKVIDTGHGIPPEALGRLFDRFYKGEGSRGSGLGLAIAKGIVTAHGGEISATSRVGEGTTIEFTLPRSAAEL